MREKREGRVDCYEVSWLTRRNNGRKLAREVGVSWHQGVAALAEDSGGAARGRSRPRSRGSNYFIVS